MQELTDEEYQLLLKIASGMRNSDHFIEDAKIFEQPVYDMWDYDDRKPWDNYDRHINAAGKEAMRAYEAKHGL